MTKAEFIRAAVAALMSKSMHPAARIEVAEEQWRMLCLAGYGPEPKKG